MASKIELSLSPDYVPNWTKIDGVRELFQNALDQETVNPENKMFFSYDPDKYVLRIGNKASVLETRSLLLGDSTKRDDDRTIGKFGEGYKLAILVLIRSGCAVTLYNYGKREVWRPRFVKSTKFQSNILTFFNDKKYFWQSVPDNNLIIEVVGISHQDYEDIKVTNLHLQENVGDLIETSRGKILLAAKHKGRIYVKGLYVCTNNELHYGYDINPEHITLDRDRKLINDFNIKWEASAMWGASKSDLAVGLARAGAPDVAYLDSVMSCASVIKAKATTEFFKEHGVNAVPVTNQSELETANHLYEGAKPVIVSASYKAMIVNSPNYAVPIKRVAQSPREALLAFKVEYGRYLPETGKTQLDNIIQQSYGWFEEGDDEDNGIE